MEAATKHFNSTEIMISAFSAQKYFKNSQIISESRVTKQ
jgi:hypothetical protein